MVQSASSCQHISVTHALIATPLFNCFLQKCEWPATWRRNVDWAKRFVQEVLAVFRSLVVFAILFVLLWIIGLILGWHVRLEGQSRDITYLLSTLLFELLNLLYLGGVGSLRLHLRGEAKQFQNVAGNTFHGSLFLIITLTVCQNGSSSILFVNWSWLLLELQRVLINSVSLNVVGLDAHILVYLEILALLGFKNCLI